MHLSPGPTPFPRRGTPTRESSTWSATPSSPTRGRSPAGSRNCALQGDYIACELSSGEPILVARGQDDTLRGFFNVCRHHAAAIVTDGAGSARQFRCPYHGWTYALDGSLKGTPDFADVCDFGRSANGLVPVDCAVAQKWVFARTAATGPSLDDYLGAELSKQLHTLGLGDLHWMERRHYSIDCNWKVFVDNYLDGGYHIPLVHRDLEQRIELQRVHNRDRGALLPPVESDEQGRRRSADGSGTTGRPRLLLLDLSELHDQLLRSRDGYQPGDSSRYRQDRRDLRFLLRRRVGGCRRPESGEHRREPSDSAGGRFDLCLGAARSPIAGLPTRAGCRFVAKPESISFIVCCMPTSRRDLTALFWRRG